MRRALLSVCVLVVGCAHAPKPEIPLVPSGPPVDAMAAANASRRLFEGRFVDDWLGLEVAVPADFDARIDFEDALLSIRGDHAMGAVLLLPETYGPVATTRLFAEMADALAGNVGALEADGEAQPMQLEWASGVQRTWHNEHVTFTVAIGPLCAGRLTLAVLAVEDRRSDDLARDRWTHAVAQLRRAPACRAVYAPTPKPQPQPDPDAAP